MKNRILSITRDSIPYIKELRPRCGSVVACLLMQQLDYWFERYPDGFYKFKSKCQNAQYAEGDSWTEELGISDEEFSVAFSKIGVSHKSRTLFNEAADKFNGQFYCNYFDRKTGLTHYLRNHDMVDDFLDNLMSSVNRQSRFTETKKSKLQKPTKSVSINQQSQDIDTEKVGISYITETTTEINSETTTEFFSSKKSEKDFLAPSVPQNLETEKENVVVFSAPPPNYETPAPPFIDKPKKAKAPRKDKADNDLTKHLHQSFVDIFDAFYKKEICKGYSFDWDISPANFKAIRSLRLAITRKDAEAKALNGRTQTDATIKNGFSLFLEMARKRLTDTYEKKNFNPVFLNSKFNDIFPIVIMSEDEYTEFISKPRFSNGTPKDGSTVDAKINTLADIREHGDRLKREREERERGGN